MAALALVLLATQSSAFVLYPGSGRSLARWPARAENANANANTTEEPTEEGLGRGLGFVIDPSLCRTLLPHFAEANNGYWSVGCDDIENSILRALGAWAANSPYISFFDAGPQCGVVPSTAESGPEPLSGDLLPPGADCAAADVYIQAQAIPQGDARQPMIRVNLLTSSDDPGTTAVVSAAPRSNADIALGIAPVLGRAGMPAELRSITKAVITVMAQPGVEWYLDVSICDWMLTQTYDVILFMYIVTIVSIVAGCRWAYRLTKRTRKRVKEEQETWQLFHTLLALFEQVCALISILVLLFVPTVVLFGFLAPCLRQYPLEPALLHAVGASLGLGNASDPNATHMELEWATCSSLRTLSANFSFDPLASADGSCGQSTWTSESTWWTCDNRRASVMLAVAPTHTLSTITQDDLDALDTLYPPPCNATRLTGPLQMPSASWHAGWTLLVTVLLPLGLLAFLLPPCAALARCIHRGCSPVDEDRVEKGGREQSVELASADTDVPAEAKPSGREYRM